MWCAHEAPEALIFAPRCRQPSPGTHG
jgi:hypothetical protein